MRLSKATDKAFNISGILSYHACTPEINELGITEKIGNLL